MDLDIEKANGLPPVERDDARLLILGTFPGRLALERRQYYPDPRNKFWEIMGRLFGAARDIAYEERLCCLKANGIAIWDVVAACQRQGSSDSGMKRSSIEVNDFGKFLDRHRRIAVICFNGKRAKEIWDDKVLSPTVSSRLRYAVLPNSAGPNTRMTCADGTIIKLTFGEKLSRWRSVLCREVGCNRTST